MAFLLPFKLLILTALLYSVRCSLIQEINVSVNVLLPNVLNSVVLTANKNEVNFFLTGDVNEPVEESVKFWCANRKSPQLLQTTLDSTDIKAKVNIDGAVMFIIHGWTDNYSNHWVKDTVRDALTFFDVTVCAVDWGNLAHYEYSASVNHTTIVSEYTTKFIQVLIDLNVAPVSINLVGHGLGAQISGQIGYKFNGKLGQIYGLDPAGSLFVDGPLSLRLDKTDAEYVQVILTGRGKTSVTVGEGHENFYPNGGTAPQPNCAVTITSDSELAELLICSNLHAYTLFRLSMNPLILFPARLCRNWEDYLEGRCFLNRVTRMGIHSIRLGGDFYLRTSSKPPYSFI